MTSTSDSNFEDFFLSPVSDEDYIKRMKYLRESFKFQKLKYGKVSEKIAVANFRNMFSETGNGLSHDPVEESQ